MQQRRPPTLPGRLPPPPGGRDPPPLDHRDGSAAARRRRSPATATKSMPMIDIGALFIGREDWEGNDGSGVAKEDQRGSGGVRVRFLGGRPPPTLGRAFWEEEDDNEDVRDKQGRRAQRRRCDAVNVRDALRGRAAVVIVHKGGRGGSVTDETITDGAKTMVTMERGMLR
jgi:hypothetical protein